LLGHPRFQMENTAIKMIANRVGHVSEGQTLFNKLNTVVSRYLKLPLTYLGAIPQDNQLSQAVMQQMPVSLKTPNARSTQAFESIAANLISSEDGQAPNKRGMAAFFSHIIRSRKDVQDNAF
jgi:flagellar biosynthesis protein FlhG